MRNTRERIKDNTTNRTCLLRSLSFAIVRPPANEVSSMVAAFTSFILGVTVIIIVGIVYGIKEYLKIQQLKNKLDKDKQNNDGGD